jgi:stage V sporulation protein T
MKSTGIVRRIDDLGRVVIPKEIRQTLRIKEGDALELWLDGNTICFKKYNVIAPFEDNLKAIVDMLDDEDVSRKISKEDRTCVMAMVNMLLAKWKESDHNAR